MKTYTLAEVEAYALGYYDGRTFGNEERPEDFSQPQCHAYRMGYERGIGDYCELDMTDGGNQ